MCAIHSSSVVNTLLLLVTFSECFWLANKFRVYRGNSLRLFKDTQLVLIPVILVNFLFIKFRSIYRYLLLYKII